MIDTLACYGQGGGGFGNPIDGFFTALAWAPVVALGLGVACCFLFLRGEAA